MSKRTRLEEEGLTDSRIILACCIGISGCCAGIGLLQWLMTGDVSDSMYALCIGISFAIPGVIGFLQIARLDK